MEDLDDGVLAQLPQRGALKKMMRRRRRRDLPANPTSLQDLQELPLRFTTTKGGEKFLLYDSFEDEDDLDADGRVLVFGTKANLELLAQCSTWFLDGTFKVSPAIFTQLFTIIGTVTTLGNNPKHIAFPLIYALLSSKETKHYEAALRAVSRVAQNLGIAHCRPQRVMTDFELGIINATSSVFPNVPQSACSFHLGQSVYRHIQEQGLQTAYRDPTDKTVKRYVHSMLALAHVPLEDVLEASDELFEDYPDCLEGIVDYFDNTYIRGKPARGRRKAVPPRYPPQLWNAYEATLQGLHRTNNVSEGWHTRFMTVVGRLHPDLYTLLKELRKEQADVETQIRELRLGRKVRDPPKKKWIEQQEKKRELAESYGVDKEEKGIRDYLRRMGYYITL